MHWISNRGTSVPRAMGAVSKTFEIGRRTPSLPPSQKCRVMEELQPREGIGYSDPKCVLHRIYACSCIQETAVGCLCN